MEQNKILYAVGQNIEAGILRLRQMREKQSNEAEKALLLRIEAAFYALKNSSSQLEDMEMLNRVIGNITNCPTAADMASHIIEVVEQEPDKNKMKLSILETTTKEITQLSQVVKSLQAQKKIAEASVVKQKQLFRRVWLILGLLILLFLVWRKFV